jgi:hypothetical protein
MSVDEQQFQLPLRISKGQPESVSVPDRARRERPGLSISGSQIEPALTIRYPRAAVAASAEEHMTTPTFVALTDLTNLRAAGIAYPSTVHGWRWLFRHRHERGLGDAFRRIGRRIVVDPQRYRELVRASSGG